MAISLDKVIASLVDRRCELRATVKKAEAEVQQIETALGALGQMEQRNPWTKSAEWRAKNGEAQRRRYELRKSLGLSYMATNAQVEAALAARTASAPDLAIAG